MRFLVLARLCGTALLAYGALSGAFAQDESPRREPVDSSIVLPSGRVLVLPGNWTETKTLGGKHAFVSSRLTGWDRELVSLDVGASEPRATAQLDFKYGGVGSGIAWEPDGSACYAWLGEEWQLCRIDATTGVVTSLTSFPTHMFTWCSRHCDPRPVANARGFVLLNGVLMFVVREETNENLGPLLRSKDRRGGSWLAALDTASGSMTVLSASRWQSKGHEPWEISCAQKLLYRTTAARDRVIATTFDGAARWEAATELPIQTMLLSPDEKWLLLENRQASSWASRATYGSVIMKLGDRSSRSGPPGGHEYAWNPDSRRVAFLEGWMLRMLDVDTGAVETIATVIDTSSIWPSSGPGYWTRPVWSPDGRMLFTNVGEEGCEQIFDLEAHTVLITELSDGSFAPTAKPFPKVEKPR